MTMEAISDPETAEDLKRWLRSYSQRRLNSYLADERRSMLPNVILDFGRKRLMGMRQPRDLGGAGLSATDACSVIDQLGAIDLSIAAMVGNHNSLVVAPVAKFGSNSVKATFLSDLISGRQLGAFALSEANAGSDPRRLESTAVRFGEESWRINGKKTWVGIGGWSGVIIVFAHAFDARQKSLGITAFALSTETEGVVQGAERLTLGMRAMIQNEIHFHGVLVSEEQVLGVVGRGLDVAQYAMMETRLVASVQCIGAAKRSLQLAHRYSSRRKIASGLMAGDANVARFLTEEAAAIIACSRFARFVARFMDDPSEETPQLLLLVAKIVVPEISWKAVDRSLQTLGGRGYLESNVVSRILRDIRVYRIFEGPTEALIAHLGAVMRAKRDEIRFLLCEKLEASELWEEVRVEAEAGFDHGTAVADRNTMYSQQYLIGEATAAAIFLATVRVSPPDSNELDYSEHVERSCREKLDVALKQLKHVRDEIPVSGCIRLMANSRELFDAWVGNEHENALPEEIQIDSFLV